MSEEHRGEPHDRDAARFCLLVPVKRWSLAKTRLDGPTGARDSAARGRLMRGFARDALEAALASPAVAHVLAVCDEADLDVPGVETLPDLGAGDLNAALRLAAAQVQARDPGLGVAAMCGDLPALRAHDLTAALRAATRARWYVADAEGTGTTLLAVAPGLSLDPRFGPDSAERHEASGAAPVRAEVPTLRCDVDTETDLSAAVTLGVGRHTAAVLASG